jgi:hypothetical protein
MNDDENSLQKNLTFELYYLDLNPNTASRPAVLSKSKNRWSRFGISKTFKNWRFSQKNRPQTSGFDGQLFDLFLFF